jgi:hypothetical protein
MRPLLLHGFGTSVRVNGRTLEIYWRPEGQKESRRPQHLPFDSKVLDSLAGSRSFQARGICESNSQAWTKRTATGSSF